VRYKVILLLLATKLAQDSTAKMRFALLAGTMLCFIFYKTQHGGITVKYNVILLLLATKLH
jgi:hypothetical protein